MKSEVLSTSFKKLIQNKGGQPVTTSRIIAREFNKKHRSVLRTIRNLECSEEFSRHNFAPLNYKYRGKTFQEQSINRRGFMFLTMGFTGSKAAAFKEMFITAFDEMEELIKMRLNSAIAYIPLSDAIKSMKGNETKPRHYMNEAEMINRIVLRESSKSYKEKHNLKSSDNLRDNLTKTQLDIIQKLESIDTGLIYSGVIDYQKRKKQLENIFNSFKASIKK